MTEEITQTEEATLRNKEGKLIFSEFDIESRSKSLLDLSDKIVLQCALLLFQSVDDESKGKAKEILDSQDYLIDKTLRVIKLNPNAGEDYNKHQAFYDSAKTIRIELEDVREETRKILNRSSAVLLNGHSYQ